MPNFIPEDKMTPQLRAEMSAEQRNFIPPEGWETKPPASPDSLVQLSEAQLRRGLKAELEDARRHIAGNVPTAVDYIEKVSEYYRAIALYAEEKGQARKGVLENFPPGLIPDPLRAKLDAADRPIVGERRIGGAPVTLGG